jgi:hypothetical protein
LTGIQIILQFLGLALVVLAVRGRDVVAISLAISFWLQYQLRDLLYVAGLNQNVYFGIYSNSAIYAETILEIVLFNIVIIGVVLWLTIRGRSNHAYQAQLHSVHLIEDRAIGYGALALLAVAFIYFGGFDSRAEMLLQKGSSIMYILSLVCIVYLCYRDRLLSLVLLIVVALLSTQKLLVLAYLIVYLRGVNSLKAIGKIALLAAVLVMASLVREPELAAGTIANFLAGTIFGHYESILPLYRLNEMGSPNNLYPIEDIFTTPLLEFFEKQEKFFELFNQQYFSVDGILIAPSILGFFHYYFGSLAPLLAGIYIVMIIIIAVRVFDLIVGKERSNLLKAAFALLLLESSPDGMTFFLRLIIALVVFKSLSRLAYLGGVSGKCTSSAASNV